MEVLLAAESAQEADNPKGHKKRNAIKRSARHSPSRHHALYRATIALPCNHRLPGFHPKPPCSQSSLACPWCNHTGMKLQCQLHGVRPLSVQVYLSAPQARCPKHKVSLLVNQLLSPANHICIHCSLHETQSSPSSAERRAFIALGLLECSQSFARFNSACENHHSSGHPCIKSMDLRAIAAAMLHRSDSALLCFTCTQPRGFIPCGWLLQDTP
jgi:hypothetical protein